MQSVYLLPALFSVILNPRKPTFKVTAKDETLDRSYISELGGPFYIIFAILLAGVGMTVWRIVTQPYEADVTLVVGGWNILNLLMVGCALGVVSERRNPQSTPSRHHLPALRLRAWRRDASRHDRGRLARRRAHPHRPSSDAKRIHQDDEASVLFQPLSDIGADTLPLTVRSIVEDGNTLIVGCRFHPTSAIHFRLIADLLFANSKQWSDFQESRRVNIGIIGGTLWFLKLSIYQSFRGMAYLMRRIGAARDAEAPEPDGHARRGRGRWASPRHEPPTRPPPHRLRTVPRCRRSPSPRRRSTCRRSGASHRRRPPAPADRPADRPGAKDRRSRLPLLRVPGQPGARHPRRRAGGPSPTTSPGTAPDGWRRRARGGRSGRLRSRAPRPLYPARAQSPVRRRIGTAEVGHLPDCRTGGKKRNARHRLQQLDLCLAGGFDPPHHHQRPADRRSAAHRPREPDPSRFSRFRPTPSGPASTSSTSTVDQRHRTDCTIQSTYDLWTEFEAEGTGLELCRRRSDKAREPRRPSRGRRRRDRADPASSRRARRRARLRRDRTGPARPGDRAPRQLPAGGDHGRGRTLCRFACRRAAHRGGHRQRAFGGASRGSGRGKLGPDRRLPRYPRHRAHPDHLRADLAGREGGHRLRRRWCRQAGRRDPRRDRHHARRPSARAADRRASAS